MPDTQQAFVKARKGGKKDGKVLGLINSNLPQLSSLSCVTFFFLLISVLILRSQEKRVIQN
jgi:hypothetical protein